MRKRTCSNVDPYGSGGCSCKGHWFVSSVSISPSELKLMEFTLHAAHGRGLVMPEEEIQVFTQHLAKIGRHDDRGDGTEAETFLGIHQLFFVTQIEFGLPGFQPVGGLRLGVFLGHVLLHAGLDALQYAAL